MRSIRDVFANSGRPCQTEDRPESMLANERYRIRETGPTRSVDPTFQLRPRCRVDIRCRIIGPKRREEGVPGARPSRSPAKRPLDRRRASTGPATDEVETPSVKREASGGHTCLGDQARPRGAKRESCRPESRRPSQPWLIDRLRNSLKPTRPYEQSQAVPIGARDREATAAMMPVHRPPRASESLQRELTRALSCVCAQDST